MLLNKRYKVTKIVGACSDYLAPGKRTDAEHRRRENAASPSLGARTKPAPSTILQGTSKKIMRNGCKTLLVLNVIHARSLLESSFLSIKQRSARSNNVDKGDKAVLSVSFADTLYAKRRKSNSMFY